MAKLSNLPLSSSIVIAVVAPIFSVISSNTPVESLIVFFKSPYSSFNPFNNAFKSPTCCLPPIIAKKLFFSSSVQSANATLSSFKITSKPLNLPSESNISMFNSSNASLDLAVPEVKLINTAFNARPASPPLIPRFAITDNNVIDSSSGTFN